MASLALSTSTALPQSGTVSFRGYKTWYILFGTISATGPVPLVAVHGGPSAGHNYLLPLGALQSRCGIPVLLYDQIGYGRSSHLRDVPPSTITVEFFLDELANLLQTLGIERYDLLGHSWGAILSFEVAARQPAGLRQLIIYGGMASMPLGEQVRYRCYEQLGSDALKAILQHEKDGKATKGYKEAMSLFMKTYMCRADPLPQEFLATLGNMQEDPTVQLVLLGKSNTHTTGSLEHWSIIDRTYLIKNKTLVVTGEFDYCGAEALTPLVDGIPDVRLVSFTGASHLSHFEEKEGFMGTIVEFLQS